MTILILIALVMIVPADQHPSRRHIDTYQLYILQLQTHNQEICPGSYLLTNTRSAPPGIEDPDPTVDFCEQQQKPIILVLL